MKTLVAFALLSLVLSLSSATHADTFGSGGSTFDIDFVTIGNPGNADDTTGNPNPAGKVDYAYRMGKFEISEVMIDKANALSDLGITHHNRGANKPATSVSWPQAAQFTNWLNTDSGGTPAYKFDGGGNFQLWQPGDAGYDPNNLYRNTLAKYFLPSMDEWYKSAYYDPTGGVYYNYPTGHDSPPTSVFSGTQDNTAVWGVDLAGAPADITQAGGLSPHGTMGQGGNVWEFEETSHDLLNNSVLSSRGIRGGGWLFPASEYMSTSWRHDSKRPFAQEYDNVGFRVASAIPEPTTLLLAAMASIGLYFRRRR